MGASGVNPPVVERAFASHRRIALAVTAAALALAPVARNLDHGAQIAILAIGLLSTGVPHGAVDHARMAPALRRRLGRAWLPVFLSAYLALAAAVAALWLAAPVASLGLFLAMSAHHFGRGDADDGLGVVVHGSLPILAPCAAHPDAVSGLFATLTAADASSWHAALRDAQPVLALAAGALIALHLVRPRRHAGATLEVLAVAAAGAVLPPLVSFSIYFSVWHAPRHILLVAQELRPGPQLRSLAGFARNAMPMTLATAGLGAIAFFWLPPGEPPSDRLLQVVFVGLAAL
ncbi:MAG: hypothetical protein FJ306_14920, partial [Planctomycetes bacterium]|nr:hypothetical protein [Planctomycetota bacterium]